MYFIDKILLYFFLFTVLVHWSTAHSQTIQKDNNFYYTGEIRLIQDFYMANGKKKYIHWMLSYHKDGSLYEKRFTTKDPSKHWTRYHRNGKILREPVLIGDIAYDTLGNIFDIDINYTVFQFDFNSIRASKNFSKDSVTFYLTCLAKYKDTANHNFQELDLKIIDGEFTLTNQRAFSSRNDYIKLFDIPLNHFTLKHTPRRENFNTTIFYQSGVVFMEIFKSTQFLIDSAKIYYPDGKLLAESRISYTTKNLNLLPKDSIVESIVKSYEIIFYTLEKDTTSYRYYNNGIMRERFDRSFSKDKYSIRISRDSTGKLLYKCTYAWKNKPTEIMDYQNYKLERWWYSDIFDEDDKGCYELKGKLIGLFKNKLRVDYYHQDCSLEMSFYYQKDKNGEIDSSSKKNLYKSIHYLKDGDIQKIYYYKDGEINRIKK